MPVVLFYGKYRWLPPDGEIKTQEHALTHSFLDALPGMIAEAINATDAPHAAPPIQVGEVLILPLQAHPWAQNAFDFSLDVQPGDTDDTFEGRRRRRYAIATRLQEAVHAWLAMYADPDLRPSFDVDCRPQDGSGISTGAEGVILHRWGVPDGLPIPEDFDPAERTVVWRDHCD